MDDGRTLDRHLERALDELLSLATAATSAGRPELALAASAALDPLLDFLADAPEPHVADIPCETPGERSHAQH